MPVFLLSAFASISKLPAWVYVALAAAGLTAGGFLYVSHLNSKISDLTTENSVLTTNLAVAQKQGALNDEAAAAALARAKEQLTSALDLAAIRQGVTDAPASADGVLAPVLLNDLAGLRRLQPPSDAGPSGKR